MTRDIRGEAGFWPDAVGGVAICVFLAILVVSVVLVLIIVVDLQFFVTSRYINSALMIVVLLFRYRSWFNKEG